MDIHKPKPIHGWRELFGEIGVIVIGVLIALGAEQAVEAIHWREQVKTGREALRDDFIDVLGLAQEREEMSPCIGQRLAEIGDIIDRASANGRLPPVGFLGNPAKRTWHFASWDSLVSSQVSNHFPREQMLDVSSLAAYATQTRDLNEREFEDWSTLYTIVGPGRRFGEAEEANLRSALSHAAYDAKLMRIAAYQMTQHISGIGMLDKATVAKARNRIQVDYGKLEICAPIGPAPAHYGASPFNYGLDGDPETGRPVPPKQPTP